MARGKRRKDNVCSGKIDGDDIMSRRHRYENLCVYLRCTTLYAHEPPRTFETRTKPAEIHHTRRRRSKNLRPYARKRWRRWHSYCLASSWHRRRRHGHKQQERPPTKRLDEFSKEKYIFSPSFGAIVNCVHCSLFTVHCEAKVFAIRRLTYTFYSSGEIKARPAKKGNVIFR